MRYCFPPFRGHEKQPAGYLDGLDTAGTVARIKEILQSQDKLMTKKEEPAEEKAE